MANNSRGMNEAERSARLGASRVEVNDQTLMTWLVDIIKWLWVALIGAVVELFRRERRAAQERKEHTEKLGALEKARKEAIEQNKNVIKLLNERRVDSERHAKELVDATITRIDDRLKLTDDRVASIEQHLRTNNTKN